MWNVEEINYTSFKPFFPQLVSSSPESVPASRAVVALLVLMAHRGQARGFSRWVSPKRCLGKRKLWHLQKFLGPADFFIIFFFLSNHTSSSLEPWKHHTTHTWARNNKVKASHFKTVLKRCVQSNDKCQGGNANCCWCWQFQHFKTLPWHPEN